jgi:hypothetical protein
MLTADLNFALVFSGLCEIIGKLHRNYPRLTPWAAFLRRFTAGIGSFVLATVSLALRALYPHLRIYDCRLNIALS